MVSHFPSDLPLGLLCFAVGGGAQVPRHGRGTPDHSGPRPGRRWQPLPHWTCKESLSVCRGGTWEVLFL